MKRIFKYLMICTLTLMIIVSIPVGNVVIDGYLKYKEVISSTSLQEKIKTVQSDKTYTKIEDIDKDFLNGIVSVEDHRFYRHNGLDYVGIARAAVNNLKAGKIVQGGSSITQQLAKNLYLNGDKNFSRKVAEVFLVRDIEKKYSKEEILEIYVNIINYGNGYIGIKEASEGYFNEEPYDLSLDEASMLAGLPQCPEGYNPKLHYDKAIARKEKVLASINKYSSTKYHNEYYLLLEENKACYIFK